MIEGAGFRAIGVGGVGDALSAAGRQLNAAAEVTKRRVA